MIKATRNIFRALLAIAIVAMGYLCVMSIITPIEFENEQIKRENAIIKNLIEIRNAQVEYRNQYGKFLSTGDSIVDFIKNGKVAVVLKEGALTDEQFEAGLTEKKAMEIINRGRASEIKANGLENFRRDTTYVSVYESFFAEKYTLEEIEKIAIIPFSNGKKFEISTSWYTNPNTPDIKVPLFQACAPYDLYLNDLDKQELINLKDKREKLGLYLGLKVGSIDEPNNNAGNWE